jgi:lipopolysaccharide biosynthesis glycosyltransferase
VLVYRERGAVAGEGTALKIGNTTSTADVWTEISQPPYFVAYHGAFSQNVDIAVFTGAPQPWTTVSAPKTLEAGAEWKLTAQDGVSSTLKLQALAGTHATILDTDDHFPGKTMIIEADWANGAWTIDKLHYSAGGEDANQGLTIAVTNAKFEVTAGRKTRIADGTVHPDGWEFKDPAWLRGTTVR